MGRQFQLETIPRFQWRVIVEVCSGLAQTKLDSTNFWVIECDVRFGIKSAVLTVGQSLPIYLHKQTFSESDGMSQMCQQRRSLFRSSRRHGRASGSAWSFGQPGSTQSFLVLFDVFGLPIGASTSLRLETRSSGFSCRSRATDLGVCSSRPAIALLAASIRNPP
jgi:hypothetical protein